MSVIVQYAATKLATVKLISVTDGALDLLLHTKNTRLRNDEDVASWSPEKKQEHLDYMLDTIKSSWEFVDYTFEITGVSRAFTHQLVRTRSGSYAQQSQRTVNVADMPVVEPEGFGGNWHNVVLWEGAVHVAKERYSKMIEGGMPIQDARGILPTNIATDIIAKFNLRTLSEMAKVRLCTRTQGEYQDVFRGMRECVLHVHPWADDFIQVNCVASGTCAFPRYGKKECKFYDPRMDLTVLKEDVKAKFWSSEKQVAVPVAVNGKTM